MITGSIMDDSFSRLEEREVAKNVLRATEAIDSQTDHLVNTAKDWGQWEATYLFLHGDNSYIDDNLDAGTLPNLHIDMMLFYDVSGKPYYSLGVNRRTFEETEVSPAFLEALSNELFSGASPYRYISGIVNTPEGPMLVGTSPIIFASTDDVAGTLVIAKFLDPELIAELGETTQLSINIKDIDPDMPVLSKESTLLQDSERLQIDYTNEGMVIGTTLLNDINGAPSKVMEVEMPRDVYQQGQSAIHYVLYSLLAIGVIYGFVLILLIERSVLARLSLLSRNVNAITEGGSLSSRVDMDGNDELYMLADNINYMLQTLEENEDKIQAAEHENKQKMETVLANIISGVLIIDARTHMIVDVNTAAEEIIGLTKEKIVGNECHHFVCPAERGKCPISDLRMDMNRSERMLINGEGKKIWILKSVVPVTLSGRNYFIESFVDLREIKEVQENLIQARIAAEAANRAKSDFLATMSHELRTPLNSIIGFSDLILSGSTGIISDTQKRFMENIAASGKHLLYVINNVLDISKIEANKMELNFQVFPVESVFIEVGQLISPLADKKGLKVEFYRSKELRNICADKTIFKQILFNLVSNAIKFTPKHGNVSVCAHVKGEMARFEVKDTGIGISEEDQSRLFQPFTQLDSAINRQYAGTGLGLTLVKRFIELHNGNIRIESKVGKGTTFTFELPLKGAAKEKAPLISNVEVQPGSDKILSGIIEPVNSAGDEPLVLVVEDDDNSRELLEVTLANEGYRVSSTSSGEEALRLAGNLRPFAITLDIMMPGMDGWNVLKNLKEEERTKDIPVIITSMLDEREMGSMWEAVDYFIKPVQKEVLISTLERIKKDASKSRILKDSRL